MLCAGRSSQKGDLNFNLAVTVIIVVTIAKAYLAMDKLSIGNEGELCDESFSVTLGECETPPP